MRTLSFLLRSIWRHRAWTFPILLLCLTVLLRLVWGHITHRQVERAIDQIRLANQPTQASDFHHSNIPPEEDAWPIQLQAASGVSSVVDCPRNSNLDFPEYPPFNPAWHQAAAASENANAAAFALARQARQLPKARVQNAWTSLNSVKNLANVLTDGAIYIHLNGNDPEAVDRILDILSLAQSLRQDDNNVSQLVALGIDSLAANAIQIIAPGLRLQASPGTAPTRNRVQRVISILLDESTLNDGWRRSLLDYQVQILTWGQNIAEEAWVIRPLADRSLCRALQNYQPVFVAREQNNWPQARKFLMRQQRAPLYSDFRRYSRWFEFSGPQLHYFERYFRILAERRLTAISLACQLYRADHGHFPSQLAELVPTYLPKIPADPFHEDGRPIGYVIFKGKLPDGTDRPMLYYDAGGIDGQVFDFPMYDWYQDTRRPSQNPDNVMRQYRDLKRFVPSPKAVNGNPGQPSAPGNNPQQ